MVAHGRLRATSVSGSKRLLATESNLVPKLAKEGSVKVVSEYDQEIPQSQTADYPVAPRGRAAQPSRDTRKTKDLGQFPIQCAQILTASG